ncbi:Os02g0652201 [Oryza sativa Japonica Group]|uniref:Os02g0652201 protein n=1 Tax=Oryza sativa subsp. japonica TaxID=39947 RepID=A0A0N7KFS9_ORYSJ|nr:Os02g0652201 [Oryza sativa Japonica Group]
MANCHRAYNNTNDEKVETRVPTSSCSGHQGPPRSLNSINREWSQGPGPHGLASCAPCSGRMRRAGPEHRGSPSTKQSLSTEHALSLTIHGLLKDLGCH